MYSISTKGTVHQPAMPPLGTVVSVLSLSVQFTVHSAQCTVYIVHCTMYSGLNTV